MIRTLSSASLLLLLVAAHASAAINVLSVSRDTQANVTNAVQQQFTSTAAGFYNANFNVYNVNDPSGIGQAIAYHTSTTPNLVGTTMSGGGQALAQSIPSGGPVLTVSADAALDVYFNVTANQTYWLYSNAQWVNVLPGVFTGFSRVQLWDTTNNVVPHDIQRDNMLPGSVVLNQQIPLVTGVIYRLRAESHASGSSDAQSVFEANTGWGFNLFLAVPEPTSATLVALALLTAATTTRRRLR